VQSYLVEVYVPQSGAAEAHAAGRRARAAARRLCDGDAWIRYVRTTFVPGDETCFHLFEASSLELVEKACRLAHLGRARIVPAIEASRPSKQPP